MTSKPTNKSPGVVVASTTGRTHIRVPGSWANGEVQAAKDRWVYPLRRDERRGELLAVHDESLVRAGCPQYVEAA